MKKVRIIFAGTPEFAEPFLEALISDDSFEVVGVITQPDKPTGRRQVLTPPPVKELAMRHNIQIFQPESLRVPSATSPCPGQRQMFPKVAFDDSRFARSCPSNDPLLPPRIDRVETGEKAGKSLVETLKDLEPDLMVVVAYGLIIPQEILDIAKFGNINVHPSLLPKYRGASPVQGAILAGEKTTGITIMLMDEKMDHGPILAQQAVALAAEETNESLHQKMASIGVTILVAAIKDYLAGRIQPQEQNHNEATFCKVIKKDDAKIDWRQSAEEIERQIRAYFPWPVAWTIFDGKRMKIFPPAFISPPCPRGGEGGWEKKTGKIFIIENKMAVACGQGALIINKLQIEGKNEMSASDFLRGYKDATNKILGD